MKTSYFMCFELKFWFSFVRKHPVLEICGSLFPYGDGNSIAFQPREYSVGAEIFQHPSSNVLSTRRLYLKHNNAVFLNVRNSSISAGSLLGVRIYHRCVRCFYEGWRPSLEPSKFFQGPHWLTSRWQTLVCVDVSQSWIEKLMGTVKVVSYILNLEPGKTVLNRLVWEVVRPKLTWDFVEIMKFTFRKICGSWAFFFFFLAPPQWWIIGFLLKRTSLTTIENSESNRQFLSELI